MEKTFSIIVDKDENIECQIGFTLSNKSIRVNGIYLGNDITNYSKILNKESFISFNDNFKYYDIYEIFEQIKKKTERDISVEKFSEYLILKLDLNDKCNQKVPIKLLLEKEGMEGKSNKLETLSGTKGEANEKKKI